MLLHSKFHNSHSITPLFTESDLKLKDDGKIYVFSGGERERFVEGHGILLAEDIQKRGG
jgi:hypothetical protein